MPTKVPTKVPWQERRVSELGDRIKQADSPNGNATQVLFLAGDISRHVNWVMGGQASKMVLDEYFEKETQGWKNK